MDKPDVFAAIVAELESALETALSEARASALAATDPDSRAENKYDTRALEASYLARGQAQRVAELTEGVAAWRALTSNPPPVAGRVVVGALVTLGIPGGEMVYAFGPAAGGTEIVHAGRTITLVTPASPLGRLLPGKVAGDKVVLPGRPAWTIRHVA